MLELPGSETRPALRATLALIAVSVLFLAFRFYGLVTWPVVYNQDSITFLSAASYFRTWDWQAIADLSPDAILFYPFVTSLLSHVVGDLELAARLVSLLASVAAAAAAYLLASRLCGRTCGVLSLLILAVNARFVRFSYAEMTEMLWVAFACWIALIVIKNIRQPTLRHGIILGILIGLAFLTRVEAIVLVLVVPAMYWAYALVRRSAPLKPVALSTVVLMLAAVVVTAPSVLRVSHQMGKFALNGRQVWGQIMAIPDDRSSDEKLFGLDFDPRETNISFLLENPNALKQVERSVGYPELLKGHAENIARNLKTLHDKRIVSLTGLGTFAFSVVGFLALIRSGRSEDAFLISGFMAATLVAPAMYVLSMRHLLVLIPFFAVLAAVGIRESARILADALTRRGHGVVPLQAIVAAGVIAIPAWETADVLTEANLSTFDYSPAALKHPVRIVRAHAATSGRQARVMSRKSYLPYFAGAQVEFPPYTDLDGLLTYIEGREPDFLYFEERHLSGYPFAEDVGSDRWNLHFDELFATSHGGDSLILYAVRSSGEALETATAPPR